MKSRTRLSRSCSIRGRDAVKLIPDRVERRDGNENTEREREREMEGVYTRDTIPKRARQRSLSSFEGAWMRARALLTSGKPPAAYLQLRSRRPTSLSLGGEREGGRERGES